MTCFYCHQPGHMKRNCPLRYGSQVLGRRSPSYQWDRYRHSLFLHTLVWVKGTSLSRRVVYKDFRQHRQVRGVGLWVEVRNRAHKPGIRGPRGVSTPLYHKLSMQISRLCRVHFHTCICCLMHHVHYYILCERFGLIG